MKPLIALIDEAEDLNDELIPEVIKIIRETPLLLQYLRVLRNTATTELLSFESQDLLTDEGVKQATTKQGFVKGIRAFLEMLAAADAEIIQRRINEEDKKK